MTYLRTGLSLTAALTLTTLASSAFAQELPGRSVTLSFAQGLEWSDNPDLTVANESGFTTRTDLGFVFNTRTRSESFVFSLSSQLLGEFGDAGTDDFEVTNTRARIAYDRENANSSFSTFAFYSETDLGDEAVFDEETGSLVIDSGSLERTVVGAGLVLGRDGPFGLEFDARHRRRNYTGTSDPDRSDVEASRLDALARFRLNQTTAVRLSAGISTENEDDATQTERDRNYVGLGIEGENASGLNYFGDVIFDRSERTVLGPTTTVEDGVGLQLGVTQDRRNGEIGFELSSRIDDSGRRSTAEVSRSLEFPEGDVEFSLGVVDQEGDDSLRLLGGLQYERALPRGNLTASLVQNATTDEGSAVINSRLRLAYDQSINATSGWQASLSYFDSNELGGTDDDSRATASLSYTRDLTENWSMRAGVEHTRITETGAADRSSNTVFFNIERDVTFGF